MRWLILILTMVTTFAASPFVFRSSVVGSQPLTLLDGLVAYWKLDESSGTRFDEVGPIRANLNQTVLPPAITGKIGKAMTAVRANNNRAFTMGDVDKLVFRGQSPALTTNFTIVGWYTVTDNADAGTTIIAMASGAPWQIVSQAGTQNYGTPGGVGLSFTVWQAVGPGYFTYLWNDKFGAGGVKQLPAPNTWYFFAARYEYVSRTLAGKMYLRINTTDVPFGTTLAQTSDLTPPTLPVVLRGGDVRSTPTSKVNMLGYSDQSEYTFAHNGSVDEVGCWNRLLSDAEVTTLYNGGSGLTYPFNLTPPPVSPLKNRLISWWKLEETGTDYRVDSDPSDTPVLLIPVGAGDTPPRLVDVPGKVNKAVSFSNSGYLYNGASVDLSLDGADQSFTIALWFKTDSLPVASKRPTFMINSQIVPPAPIGHSFEYKFGLDGNFGGQPFLELDSGSRALAVIAANPVTPPEVNKWHCVVGVHDGPNNLIKISVDGNTFTTAQYNQATQTFLDGNVFLGIGENDYTGLMDEVVFAKRAWDMTDVGVYYNNGNGTTMPP